MTKRKRAQRILITAGPTREYVDPVRYLSNDSSGRMGFAIADAAARLGLEAVLVAGPVSLPTPPNVRRIDVVSALQMHEEVSRRAKSADVVVMAAAVADFRPAKAARQKIKKAALCGRGLSIGLKENPDILAEICRTKRPNQTMVGFSLETQDMERNSRRKLKEKGCDWIVANPARAIGAKSNRIVLFHRDGRRIPLPRMTKEELSVVILSHILA